MDTNLLVLKRVFEGVGVDVGLSDVADRKEKQKVVYLLQASGVDLGYQHGWYLMGPYSPPLTRDYYALHERQNEDDGRQLSSFVTEGVSKVRKLIGHTAKPQQLSRASWLELLASWHYLLHVSKQDKASATRTMEQKKGHLAPFIPKAEAALADVYG